MCELRCALKRPWSPRVPAPLVRLGAFLLRTEPALALEGRRCIPDRLVEEHFKFIYTNLESALADLLTETEGEVVAGGEWRKAGGERRPTIAPARAASVGRG
jgi:hypothetical protein